MSAPPPLHDPGQGLGLLLDTKDGYMVKSNPSARGIEITTLLIHWKMCLAVELTPDRRRFCEDVNRDVTIGALSNIYNATTQISLDLQEYGKLQSQEPSK